MSKNRIFYQQSLFRKLDQKRSFFDILERKEWLLDPKKWSFKKSKKSKFFKGFSPWFLSKNRIFDQGNFLGKLSHKALFLDVLDRKECFLDHIHSFKNSKNRKFFELVSPRSILDILDRKEWFLDQKSEVLKSPKIGNFSKGLVHGFCQKIEYFIRGVCFANSTRKERFMIFWIEKNAFYTM